MRIRTASLLAGCFMGAGVLLWVLINFELVGDALTVLCTDLQQQPSLRREASVNLAAACLAGDYSPDVILNLVPSFIETNPKRAERLLQLGLSQTALGISPDSKFKLLLALSEVSRRTQKYAKAEAYAKDAMKLRCDEEPPGPNDDRLFCLWALAQIARDRGNISKAEQLLNEAIENQYLYLPDSPCMQANLAALLEEKGKLKDIQNRTSEAAALRSRAALVRAAMQKNVVSKVEEPYIQSAQKKLNKALRAWESNQAKPVYKPALSANPPEPKGALKAELMNLHFTSPCEKVIAITASGVQADGIRYETSNVQFIPEECTAFGPVKQGARIADLGSYITNDSAGRLFEFSAQHGVLTMMNKSAPEAIACEAPGTWRSGSVCPDPLNKRYLGLSQESIHSILYEKSESSCESWRPIANLSEQGIESAYGLFFGSGNELYTLERDEDLRFVSLIHLSGDGMVRKRTKLSAPIPIHSEPGTQLQIVVRDNKLLLIEAADYEGVLGTSSPDVGVSWIIDFKKGDVIARAPFGRANTDDELSIKSDAN